MKSFKQLLEAPGSPAQDNKVKKDDEQEVKGYKPRSKGEEDFANAHTRNKMPHPVATDAQFTGNVEKDSGEAHTGPGSKHAGGERAAVKQGSSDVRVNQTGTRDKRTQDRPGEKTPVMQGSSKIKESFSSWLESSQHGDN